MLAPIPALRLQIRKTILLVAVLIASVAFSHTGNAQTLKWFRTVDIVLGNRGVGVTVDGSGAVYISGETNRAGFKQAYVTKFDYSGNDESFEALGPGFNSGFDGTRGIGSPSADGLGNVYIAGRTSDTLDPAAGDNGGADAFVAKYSETAMLEWTRQVFGESYEFGKEVFADASGNVYLTGWSSAASAGLSGLFLTKFDSSGVLQWSRYSGSDGFGNPLDITGDEFGNVYITGSTDDDLGGPNAGDTDGFLRSYDADGNHRWTKQIGTSNFDEARGVAADGMGSIYVTGRTDGSLVDGVVNSNSDAFLQRYDTDGNLLWTRHFIGNEDDPFTGTRGIAADNLGNVYITGNAIGVLPGDLGSLKGDAFLAKFDASGELHWATRFGGDEDLTHISWDIAVDNLGNIFVSGDDNSGDGFAFLYRFTDQAVIPEPRSLVIAVAALLGVTAIRTRYAPFSTNQQND